MASIVFQNIATVPILSNGLARSFRCASGAPGGGLPSSPARSFEASPRRPSPPVREKIGPALGSGEAENARSDALGWGAAKVRIPSIAPPYTIGANENFGIHKSGKPAMATTSKRPGPQFRRSPRVTRRWAPRAHS